jgi:hypothetical protein
MAEYWESDDLKAVAENLIANYHPHLASAKIGYLFRDKAQRKKLTLDGAVTQVVRGNSSRVSAGKYDPFIDKDFILEIPYDEWQDWSIAKRRYAVDTYLSTLQGEEDPENGEMKWYLIPFQVSMFPDVVRRWGLPFDDDRDAGYVIADALKKSNAVITGASVSDASAGDEFLDTGDDTTTDDTADEAPEEYDLLADLGA